MCTVAELHVEIDAKLAAADRAADNGRSSQATQPAYNLSRLCTRQ